jgi:hypothetical protein
VVCTVPEISVHAAVPTSSGSPTRTAVRIIGCLDMALL